MSCPVQRRHGALWLPAVLLSLSLPAAAATEHTAYFNPSLGYLDGLVAHWETEGQTASLFTPAGARQGSYTVVGARRRLVVDPPFATESYVFDSCSNLALVRDETDIYLIGVASGDASQGTSTVNPVGRRRFLTGCDAGQTEPIGSEDDPGRTVTHLAMALAPGMADLKKDKRLAGPQEAPLNGSGLWQLAQEVVSFPDRRHVRFERSGQVYARSTHPDGWMVVSLPSGPRGFLRVAVDRKTGAETWLVADMVDGQPAWVGKTDMVMADAAPSWGGASGVSRNWRLSWDYTFLEYRLYPDQTGVRYFYRDNILQPLSWSLAGERLTVIRDSRSFQSVRHWDPLARKGKNQWVMEDDTWTYTDGSTYVVAPRVVMYKDLGEGAPPLAARAAVSSSSSAERSAAPASAARRQPR